MAHELRLTLWLCSSRAATAATISTGALSASRSCSTTLARSKQCARSTAPRSDAGERPYNLSISIGIASQDPGEACSIEELMARADEAMYADKRAARTRPRLLIADDDADLCLLVERMFAADYEITTVDTGADAIRYGLAEPVDLILLDLHLPERTGTDVVRRLQDGSPSSRIPVIMIIAAGEHLELENLRAGVADFMIKPLDLGVLQARMENALKRRV